MKLTTDICVSARTPKLSQSLPSRNRAGELAFDEMLPYREENCHMRIVQALVIATALSAGNSFAGSSADLGRRDVLSVKESASADSIISVSIEVTNDQELTALDIPLQFAAPGDAIDLVQVNFSDRVKDWDFAHAQIDNEKKTVILGLFSDLTGTRKNEKLRISVAGASEIASLDFKVSGELRPQLIPFRTEQPGHALTFLYNKHVDGVPYVEEFEPLFEQTEIAPKAAGLVVPTAFGLSQNQPNPFNPSTSFTLSLPVAGHYSVWVHNILGQIVRRFDGDGQAGVVTITWDGRNDQGTAVASGVYFYRVETGGFEATKRMVLIR